MKMKIVESFPQKIMNSIHCRELELLIVQPPSVEKRSRWEVEERDAFN